ncbi:MAG TPA: acetate kinase [Candidatus Baltobacteraceae bacterium]|nr:acetate kinase [Candidatus Baltobacteraceae bacterium]
MIFVINSGSSSLKFKVYDPKRRPLASGIVERIGLEKPFLNAKVGGKEIAEEYASVPDHADALTKTFAALAKAGIDVAGVKAFGHRVVHGGTAFTEPTKVDAKVIAKLKDYYKLAPLHNPPNVTGIEAVMKLRPGVPNVAVFDTAFYRTMPPSAYMYALPYELYEKHEIRKYGFHGISHEYVAGEAAKMLKKPLSKLRLVTCHLGSGASITAVKGGKAVDTSMGFTPLEGLTMSTRCGDIDPEIPIWLIRELKMTPDQVDDLMNRKSGTLGVSGHKDMRDVMAGAKKGEKRSKLALEMFVYDVVRYIGQYMAVMGGCDAVVFTAGVGERSEAIRRMVMKPFAAYKLKHLVVPTDEEGSIARQAAKLLKM